MNLTEINPDPIEQADTLLDLAHIKWPGNLWLQLVRGAVNPLWLKRLVSQTFFVKGSFAPVIRHAVQMSWAESNPENHGHREFKGFLPSLTRMVERIMQAREPVLFSRSPQWRDRTG